MTAYETIVTVTVGAIVLLLPHVATFIVAVRQSRKLNVISENVDGARTALLKEISALRQSVAIRTKKPKDIALAAKAKSDADKSF